MECDRTESLVNGLALMQIESFTKHLEDLAMKVEIVKEAFSLVSAQLKEILKEPEITKNTEITAPLMLPAPEPRAFTQEKCPRCKKFLRKGEPEGLCPKCKEKEA